MYLSMVIVNPGVEVADTILIEKSSGPIGVDGGADDAGDEFGDDALDGVSGCGWRIGAVTSWGEGHVRVMRLVL